MGYSLEAVYRGKTYVVNFEQDAPSLRDLGNALANATGAALETLKIVAKTSLKAVVPVHDPTADALSAGLPNRTKVLLVASTPQEVQQARSHRDDPLVLGFDEELKRAARRRRSTHASNSSSGPPKGPYTFQSYEHWERLGLNPPPFEALKLLYRLASDPGIVGVMQQHQWAVGKLSEMPPEGKVGVSPVCILGVNINQGQEISLRLRTDDLKGFRKYERIRETLIHELAHMVWTDHDNNFKEFNSQLLRECAQLDWGGGARHVLHAATHRWNQKHGDEIEAWGGEDGVDEGWSERLQGGRVVGHTSGGGQVERSAEVPANPRQAAALAAVQRLTALTLSQASMSASGSEGTSDRVAPANSLQQSQPATLADVPAQIVADLPASFSASLDDLSRHEDERTERAEAAMRTLGMFPANTPTNLDPPLPHLTEPGIRDAGITTTPKNIAGPSVPAGPRQLTATTGASGNICNEEQAQCDAGKGQARQGERQAQHQSPCEEAQDDLTTTPSVHMEDAVERDASDLSSTFAGLAATARLGVCRSEVEPTGVGSMDVDEEDATSRTRRCFDPSCVNTMLSPFCRSSPGRPNVQPTTTNTLASTHEHPTSSENTGDDTLSEPATGVTPQVGTSNLSPVSTSKTTASPSDTTTPASFDDDHSLPEHKVDTAPAIASTHTTAVYPHTTSTTAVAATPATAGPSDAGADTEAPAPQDDDPAAQKYRQLKQAVHHLHASAAVLAPSDWPTIQATLHSLLQNILASPSEPKYRRVKITNPAFQRRLGRYPASLEVLTAAGFAREEGSEGAVLALKRYDPGLLWLAVSALQEAH